MEVLVVVGSIVLLLTAGAVWEARSGRPQWRSHGGLIDPSVRDAAKRAAGGSAATALWMVEGGGGDGG